MAHSSTSLNPSKKTQTVHFRATLQIAEIELFAKIRTLHQHKIELSINNLQKKRRYITQGDLFPQKVNYKDLSEDDKQIFRRFQGKTLKNLTDEMTAIGVDNEQDRLMFKRIFILYIQMAFLLPTTINKISPMQLAPIFKMDTITERNWGVHVLNFIIKGITDYNLKKKKAIDRCIFALMIVYFHLSKNKDKKRAERPLEPWIANWTREQLVERMRAEMEEYMEIVKMAETKEKMKEIKKKEKKKKQKKQKRKASSTSSSETETTESDHSTSESESEEDSEDPTRKQPTRKAKKIESRKRKKIQEDSNSESESNVEEKEADLRSTEAHYVSSETIPDVNLGSDDPLSQGHTEQSSINKPAESMFSLVEESASEPAEENMMVVREETQFEALAIVSIQVCLPLSQTTTVAEIEQTPVTENEPTPLLEIEGTTKSNPASEDTTALMMMARTASYVPKTDLMPLFSLGFTDSSQEEATTQEGATTQDGERAKTPETPKFARTIRGSVTSDMKEKCYIWAIRVKTYANGLTNEFDTVCTLQAQDKYILSKVHLASLAAETHIEAEIVSAMCLILNQQKIKRFQEEVYCLPHDIMNMAIVNHPEGVFLNPKTNRPFKVEDYPMFIPFLDLKKLASHRYIFAPVCHSDHWWLWLADTRKQKFYIVDPYHTKSPFDKRTSLNTFIGYVISRIRDKEIEPPYLNISGQKTSYDCAIYVMKWLEIIQPENIKRLKYEWDNWTQDEVDYFRVEYASRILFHEMNQNKAEAIRGSNAIRLSKPSSLLLSPYCQIDSNDI
ncbi:hypothetical protein AHAS_Ahas09G0175600 [Arachis hypogaea]